MKRFFCILLGFIILSSGCQIFMSEKKTENETIYAMDTVMTLTAHGKNAHEALVLSKEKIKELDKLWNRKSTDSEIFRINSSESTAVSHDTLKIISEAINIMQLTGGAFDITIAPIMDLWGFYTKDFRVPEDSEISATLPMVNYKNVSTEKNYSIKTSKSTEIDLGGIAKGYLSDEIANIMKESGIKSGIVSLGGNVMALGTKPDGSLWRVAIKNPESEDSFSGVISVKNKAVVTSGGYQRFFESGGKTYHHIIDPKTGYPADNGLSSVTVISENGTLADGLSTALFVMGFEKSIDFWREHGDFEAVFIIGKDKIYITEGIQNYFESDYNYKVIRRTNKNGG